MSTITIIYNEQPITIYYKVEGGGISWWLARQIPTDAVKHVERILNQGYIS